MKSGADRGQTPIEKTTGTNRRLGLCLFSLLIALCLAHVLQLFGPLRLNTDAIVLLSMALSNFQGHGLLDEGAQTVFPPGYPWLVSVLLKADMASSTSLVLLNLTFLAIGLASLLYVLRENLGLRWWQSLFVGCCTLCSWVFIKHVPLPLSEPLFFALSLVGLALIAKAKRSHSEYGAVALFVISWATILAAIGTRRIGIALMPALMWACVDRLVLVQRKW